MGDVLKYSAQLIKVQKKSTSQRALYFIFYKQQIKTQAASALHFTAVTISEENGISAFFPLYDCWMVMQTDDALSLILKGWHQNLTFMVDVFDRWNIFLLSRSIFRWVWNICLWHHVVYIWLVGELFYNSIMAGSLTLPLGVCSSLGCHLLFLPTVCATLGGRATSYNCNILLPYKVDMENM